MVNTPHSDANHDESDSNLKQIATTPETTDTAQPNKEQQQPNQHRDYSQNVMRPLKAVGKATIRIVNWLDDKGPFVTAIATVAIAVLTGFYVHYSRAQWRVMRDQLPLLKQSADSAKSSADAATSAATTATESLVLAERPWVKINHRIVSPLTFNVARGSSSVATITLENTIENVGQSVAVNVFTWEELIPLDPGFSDVLRTVHARQAETCDAYRHPKRSGTFTGDVLFPHDPNSRASILDISMPKVMRNVTHGELGSDGKPSSLNGTASFAVAGCVYYKFSFDPDSAPTHQTRFLYILGIPGEISFSASIVPEGAAPQLHLISFGFGLTAD
jgi:hypothetical protein